MTNAQLCREWVTDASLCEARTNTNTMYVRGGVLYSYGCHYPLALRYQGTVYVNNTRFSTTTSSKHRAPLIAELNARGIAYKDAGTRDMKLMVENIRHSW